MSKLTEYEMFVASKLSKPSSNFDELINSLNELNEAAKEIGVHLPELITASHGLTAESGEFAEIVKKMMYQGKPLNRENKYHLQRELGDIFFYVMVACIALGLTGDEIIEMNKEKLMARYKEGFSIEESENRAVNDL